MLPRVKVVTTKNRLPRARDLLALGLSLVVFAGCTPAGPKALLRGERLLREGRHADAVPVLQEAVRRLPALAQAHNHLGLALQGAGQTEAAIAEYHRALELDRNLSVVHFNLGCLYLDVGRPLEAAQALTSYTGLISASEPGWLYLGLAQLRARQLDAAERSFGQVLKLNPQSGRALNGLALVSVQRGRAPLAWQQFAGAARAEPADPAPVFNAAVLAHHHLKDPQLAQQRYRDCLALNPPESLRATIRLSLDQLDPEDAPVATPRPTATTSAGSGTPATNTPTPSSASLRREPRQPAPRPTPAAAPPATATASRHTESAAPARRTSPETPAVPVPTPRTVRSPSPASVASPATSPPPPTTTAAAPLPTNATPTARPASRPAPVKGYAYRSLTKPKAGDRAEATRLMQQGAEAQEAERGTEALDAYRQAAAADPSLFEAHYNLGVCAAEQGRTAEALAAYEQALAVDPTSLRARYNFAISLEKAGHARDAARELERVAADHPDETRIHFSLGRLYAEKLREPQKARDHFNQVLQREPQHPQATAIRYWIENLGP